MKTLSLFIFILLVENIIYAQNDTLGESKYGCSIDLINSPNFIKGDIYQVTDSTIIVKLLTSQDLKTHIWNYILVSNSVDKIERIIINKKGSGIKGILIGGSTGFLIGGLMGYASGDDHNGSNSISFDAGSKAVIFGTLLFIPGAIIGAKHALKKSKREIIIQGKKEIFNTSKEELKSYSIKH